MYDHRHPLKVKAMGGYLPDNVGFYHDERLANLQYTAALNGPAVKSGGSAYCQRSGKVDFKMPRAKRRIFARAPAPGYR